MSNDLFGLNCTNSVNCDFYYNHNGEVITNNII